MPWPALPLDDWQDTHDTVWRWLQIVGKVRLAHAPWVNHSWHVPLYVSARGLTTSLVPHASGSFEVRFDVVSHVLEVETTNGQRQAFDLEPMSVATFYERTMSALEDVGVPTEIWPMPVEIPGDVSRFPNDTEHAAYDRDAVGRYWQVLVEVDRVLAQFRAQFVGKVSPVHLFWGAFDLAVTRFSGRTAPDHPGGAPHLADWVMREAYSHEVSSAGFWPGAGVGEPSFYSYAYPEPDGYREYPVSPEAARYDADLGEYVLPYDAVRTADDPAATLTAFLETTYAAAADLAEWDRAALEVGGGKHGLTNGPRSV
ncbi:DUF5996 family protein [Rubrivirga sp.]|uniref:DUF5996 family protein n=1 Tax=Rubrivirga sp. TaxID=1885344 RepID=UPI003C768FB0